MGAGNVKAAAVPKSINSAKNYQYNTPPHTGRHVQLKQHNHIESTVPVNPEDPKAFNFPDNNTSPPSNNKDNSVITKRVWVIESNEHRSIICRFCGGSACKREDWTKQKQSEVAIPGLHSTWISSSIIGMQRPSSRLIKQHNLVAQFKQHNIHCLINLQLRGEHSLCGDGIQVDSGFSYDPTEFTDFGIYYYNFGWVDMSIPSLERMIQIVQVINYHQNERQHKIAVHCHAGYGRTGIVIACYFIYSYGLQPHEAIQSVRDRRPGSVQTPKQVKFVSMFYQYCTYLRTIFIDVGLNVRQNPYYQQAQQLAQQKLQVINANNSNGGNALNNAALNNNMINNGSNNTNSNNNNNSNSNVNSPNSLNSSSLIIPIIQSTPTNIALSSATIIGQLNLTFTTHKYTLQDNLVRQRAILQGPDREEYRYIPKLIALLCNRLYLTGTTSPYFLASCFVDGFRVAVNMEEQKEMEREANKNKLKLFELQKAKLRAALNNPQQQQYNLNVDFSSVIGAQSLNSVPNSLNNSNHYNNNNHNNNNNSNNPPPSNNPMITAAAAGFTSVHLFYNDAKDNLYDNSQLPKWGISHEDYLINMKRRINIGDWSVITNADPRYLTALLFDYLDDLLLPILPVLASSISHNNNNKLVHSNSNSNSISNSPPPVLVPSPASAFHAIPTGNLVTINCIVNLLLHLHEVDTILLSRVYVRFAFALLHPAIQLPDTCSVKSWIGNSNFIPDSILFPNNNANENKTNNNGNSMNGNNYHANRPLLDSLIEFMHGFLNVFPTLYHKYNEDQSNQNRKIGVRSNEHLNATKSINNTMNNTNSNGINVQTSNNPNLLSNDNNINSFTGFHSPNNPINDSKTEESVNRLAGFQASSKILSPLLDATVLSNEIPISPHIDSNVTDVNGDGGNINKALNSTDPIISRQNSGLSHSNTARSTRGDFEKDETLGQSMLLTRNNTKHNELQIGTNSHALINTILSNPNANVTNKASNLILKEGNKKESNEYLNTNELTNLNNTSVNEPNSPSSEHNSPGLGEFNNSNVENINNQETVL